MHSLGESTRLAPVRSTEADAMTLLQPSHLPDPWVRQPDARERWRSLVPALLRVDPLTSVVGVCSTLHGEGTSTLVSGLACACAEAQTKTLVLNVSEISPASERLWQSASEPDVADRALLSRIELGWLIADPEARLAPRLKRTIMDLRGRARVVLIDLEPIKDSAQVFGLAGALDVVYLVVEAERERREVIARSVESLTRAGIHVGGVILNKRVRPIPNFLYRWL